MGQTDIMAASRAHVGMGNGQTSRSVFDRLPPLLKRAQQWLDRRRQHQALDQLDDRLLKDIGLTRLDVEQEIRKPYRTVV